MIPLDDLRPLTPTNKPRNEANVATLSSHDNLGVDDGLLDSDGTGPTVSKPHPAGPEANEPGEVDAEEPGRRVGGEGPQINPRPRPRPDNPVRIINQSVKDISVLSTLSRGITY